MENLSGHFCFWIFFFFFLSLSSLGPCCYHEVMELCFMLGKYWKGSVSFLSSRSRSRSSSSSRSGSRSRSRSRWMRCHALSVLEGVCKGTNVRSSTSPDFNERESWMGWLHYSCPADPFSCSSIKNKRTEIRVVMFGMERQRLEFFRHLQEFTRMTLPCWSCWPQCLVYPSKRSSSRSGKGSSPQKRSRSPSPSSSPEGGQKRSRSRSSSGGRKRRRSRSRSSERFGFLWNTTLPLIVDSYPHYQPNAPSLVNLN